LAIGIVVYFPAVAPPDAYEALGLEKIEIPAEADVTTVERKCRRLLSAVVVASKPASFFEQRMMG
jgi:hypothetical protein